MYVVRRPKIYSLGKFSEYNTILLLTALILYVRSLDCVFHHFSHLWFIIFGILLHLPFPFCNHHSTLCFLVFDFLDSIHKWDHTILFSCSAGEWDFAIFIFLSLFHLHVLQVHPCSHPSAGYIPEECESSTAWRYVSSHVHWSILQNSQAV
jgi:hypothetical protein